MARGTNILTRLQSEYIEEGKFKAYLKGKVSRGELPPSVAQLAITAMAPDRIGNG